MKDVPSAMRLGYWLPVFGGWLRNVPDEQMAATWAEVRRLAVRSEQAPGDDSVSQALAKCPEVLELHHVAGDDCYLLKVRARDAEHVGQLLRHRFGRIPGVRSTRTTIVLETVKETPRLPVRVAPEASR